MKTKPADRRPLPSADTGPFAPLCLVDEWTSNWGDALPRADVFEAGATPSLTVTAKNVQNAAYTARPIPPLPRPLSPSFLVLARACL